MGAPATTDQSDWERGTTAIRAELTRVRDGAMLEACRHASPELVPRTVVCQRGLTFCDPGALPEWLGVGRSVLVARSIIALVHPDDQVTTAQTQSIPAGTVLHAFANRLRHAEGGWVPLLWEALEWYGEKAIARVYNCANYPAISASLRHQWVRRQRLAATAVQGHPNEQGRGRRR